MFTVFGDTIRTAYRDHEHFGERSYFLGNFVRTLQINVILSQGTVAFITTAVRTSRLP